VFFIAFIFSKLPHKIAREPKSACYTEQGVVSILSWICSINPNRTI